MSDPLLLTDGDNRLLGVNNRMHARQLDPGLVADALNRMFDRGVIRNRWSVIQPAWGSMPNLAQVKVTCSPDSKQVSFSIEPQSTVPLPPLVAPGVGFSNLVRSFVPGLTVDSPEPVDSVVITVDSGSYYEMVRPTLSNLSLFPALLEWTHPVPFPGPIVGIGSFSDPEFGRLMLLVAIDAPRADGGQGRVYAVQTGVGPVEVPLNGHDFDGAVRFIQAFNGVVMLRHGPGVFYFRGDQIAFQKITLNVPIPFPAGTRVEFGQTGSRSPGSVISGTYYFAGLLDGKVTLHKSRSDALNLIDPIQLGATQSTDRYFLRRVDGSDAVDTLDRNNGVPLIMQPSESNREAIAVGFVSVPTQLFITGASASRNTLSIPNHRLLDGDEIVISSISGVTGVVDGTYFVSVESQSTVRLHEKADESLGGINAVDITEVTTPSGTVRKSASSGAPIPPGREGVYFQNRLLLLYGRDLLAVSDVLDPLHYMPFASEFRLNAGTDDAVVAITPFNETTLVVFKERSILAIENIYGDLSQVRLTEITREYGCIAPLSVVSAGSDIFFLSQRGVCSIKQTAYGLTQSVALPVSESISGYIDTIDWPNAGKACAAYFNNCYLLSVPCRDIASRTLVYSFLTGTWQGRWEGDLLRPLGYSQLQWGGDPVLVFADASQRIHMFGQGMFDHRIDGRQDAIRTRVLTRGYTMSSMQHKQFNRVDVLMSTWNPNYSIRAVLDGVSERVALLENQTMDRTRYLSYGGRTYSADNSSFDFDAPFRRDYSAPVGFRVRSDAGIRPGVRQSKLRKISLGRRHGDTLQLEIETGSGLVEVQGIGVEGVDWSQTMRPEN